MTSTPDAHVVPHTQMLEMLRMLGDMKRKLVRIHRAAVSDSTSPDVPAPPGWLLDYEARIRELEEQYIPMEQDWLGTPEKPRIIASCNSPEMESGQASIMVPQGVAQLRLWRSVYSDDT